MSKRPADGDAAAPEGCGGEGGLRVLTADGKRIRVGTDDELEAIIQERIQNAVATRALAPVPLLLQETFTPNDPVHGLMHLPEIVRRVVDTRTFQRMRHIRQLGVCSLLYPGAVHNRFFHSIGTAFLAYELVKDLKHRQPQLGITDRDILCVTLAGLCHDLGHPCFSHMFETFMHELGMEKRKAAQEAAREKGLQEIPQEEEAIIRKHESWTHERASIELLRSVYVELKDVLEEAGLRADGEGDDYACIEELIDPPKRRLEQLLESGRLFEDWSQAIKGRPVRKAWLYEIVSNWRSGIDVDKFDYFRRDALYLGLKREFDHDRYMKGLRVAEDDGHVPTLSPPEKERDTLRENMMELRKHLHRSAYQHKTAKKIETHMVDILKMMDPVVRVVGTAGRRMSMSEAALDVDRVAYPKLTDILIESKLLEGDDPALQGAAEEYEQRIFKRRLMRLVAEWELPRTLREGSNEPFPTPDPEVLISGALAEYPRAQEHSDPDKPLRKVPRAELRCQAVKIHYGMGSRDPISRVVFHSSKDRTTRGFGHDFEAKPLRQKVFLFWNPPVEELKDEVTLKRLTLGFQTWARRQVEGELVTVPASPSRNARPPRQELLEEPPSASGGQQGPAAKAAAAAAAPPPPMPSKPKRQLRMQASCPPLPPL